MAFPRCYKVQGLGGRRVIASEVEGTPVNVFLDFEAGTIGNIITPSNLNAATHGASPGTWAYSNGQQSGVPLGPVLALTHTFIGSGNGDLREAVACNGVSYPGTGTRCLLFDQDEATDPADYEGVTWTPTAPLTGSFSVSSRMKFNISAGGDTSLSVDLLTLYYGGIYIAAQLHFPGGGTAGIICAHSSGVAGSVDIDANTWYDVTVRANVPEGRGEVVVQLASTGAIVGTAFIDFAPGPTDELTFLLVWNYLVNGGGQFYHDNILLGWGANAVLPFGTVAVEPPETLAVTQTGEDELRITWTGRGIEHEIQRRIDGGSWTSLEAAWVSATLAYFDDGVTDGDSVEYRVREIVGANVSDWETSDAVVVNNNPAGFDTVWQRQDNNNGTVSVNTHDDAPEDSLSQKIKGINGDAIGISKITLYIDDISVEEAVSVQINSAADGSGTVYATSNSVLLAEERTFADGVTNTDTTLESETALFRAFDVGRVVSGTGIALGTTIASVEDGNSVTLSQATTATATGVSVTIEGGLTIPGAVTFEFFTPVSIPAETDFYFRLIGDWAIFSAQGGYDEFGYFPGEGYDLLHNGNDEIGGLTADLRFQVYVKHSPVPLASVSRSQTGEGEVTLSWTDTNDGLTSYRVDQYHGSYTDNVQETAQGATSAIITGLTDGEVYKWRVQAFIDGAVGSESSKVESSTITIDDSPYALPTFTDATSGASTDTSDNNPAAWRQAVVCGTTGSCVKLRMWCRTFNFAASVKMALFDSSNNLLGSGEAVTVTTSAGSWVEVTLTSPVGVTASTTYKIGVTTATAGLQLGYDNGTGNCYVDFTSYASFPPNPWSGADNQSITCAVGMGVL